MANYFKPVIFKLGNESYGVDINYVSSIEKQVNFVSVPNTISYVKGIINLRDEVIPLISLKKKFNLDNADVPGDNAIIVKLSEGLSIALEVDAVEEIHDIDESAIVNMPSIVKSEELRYFDKVANINGKLIVIINLEYLLSENEKNSVIELADNLQ